MQDVSYNEPHDLLLLCGFTELECAVALRDLSAVRRLLRSGLGGDPAVQVGPKPIASLAAPTAGRPRCRATIDLLRDYELPWSPERHSIHHVKVRAAVSLMLHIAVRLGASEATWLPREIWYGVLTHISRRFWWRGTSKKRPTVLSPDPDSQGILDALQTLRVSGDTGDVGGANSTRTDDPDID